jgi:hypothetical protein
LIATANANGVEPVAYLTECLDNHEDLATRPEYYLPWVYRARLETHNQPVRGCPSPAAANRYSTRSAIEHPLRPGAHRGPTEDATGPPPMTTARVPASGLRDLSPELREAAARGVAAPDQDLKLTREE